MNIADQDLNKKELKLIFKIEDELKDLERALQDFKKTVEALKAFNLIELTRENLAKEDEIELIKSMFDSYNEITNIMVKIAKQILDLKNAVDHEII